MILRLLCLVSLVAFSVAAVDSTYAFAQVRNVKNGKSERFCVNYQQYQNTLPESPETATPIHLSWFTNIPNKTEICDRTARQFDNSSTIVPIRYVTRNESASCLSWATRNSSYMDQQMVYLNNHGVLNCLMLVEKGKPVEVAPDIHKYLFSQFYNPELTKQTPNVFYMYYEQFFDKVLALDDQSLASPDTNLEMLFYRPKSILPFDLSELIILIIAVFCIVVGSIWGARQIKEDQLAAMMDASSEGSIDGEENAAEEGALTGSNGNTTNTEAKDNQPIKLSHQLISVGVAVFFIVCILLLAFFFRNVAIIVFNIFVVIFGTFSIARCLTALARFTDPQVLSLNLLCCNKFSENSFLSKKYGVFAFVAHLFALSFCLTWFFLRQKYYAFWLLDAINICLCIVAIKAAQCRSLSILVLLLAGMFIYDIIMVFGTKLLTKNGCSVMIQVVTGVDCNQRQPATGNFYPIAPIEQSRPEIMPILFYVPRVNDVMQACYDLAVEKEYRHIMLGLGDVIVPGYLIVYCFIVDRIKKPSRIGYGPIAVIGYVAGLVVTFLALRLMQLAQPALIYLVPFTVIPIVSTALLRGHLKEMWYGKFSNTDDV